MTMHQCTAQQAVRDCCGFAQLNHATYTQSRRIAPSDYFLFTNLKSHLRGTRFADDESLAIAVEAWFWSQNKEFYYQRTNEQHSRKVEKVH